MWNSIRALPNNSRQAEILGRKRVRPSRTPAWLALLKLLWPSLCCPEELTLSSDMQRNAVVGGERCAGQAVHAYLWRRPACGKQVRVQRAERDAVDRHPGLR